MTKPANKRKKHIHKSTIAAHHLSLRKKAGHTKLNFIDHMVLFSGPLIPVAVFIQAYNVWMLDDGHGLSLITWSLMLFASITMAVYAVHHKTWPLIYIYIPLVIANALVVAGIILN